MAISKVRQGYEVDVKHKGKRYFRKYFKGIKLETAQAINREAISSARKGVSPFTLSESLKQETDNLAETSVGALIQRQYLLHWSKQNQGKSSKSNAIRLASFFPSGLDTDINALTRKDLNNAIVSLRAAKETVSDATCNRYLASISVLYTLAEDEEILTTRKPKFPRYKESEGRMRLYSDEERLAQLAAVKRHELPIYFHFLTLAYETGARLSELLAINLVLDVTERALQIHSSNSRGTTKSGKIRLVPLTESSKKTLEALKGYGNIPFKSLSKDLIGRLFVRLRGRLKVPVEDREYVFHTIRHSVATRLLASGRSIFEVAEWLGHSDIKMTRKYLKMTAFFEEKFEESLHSTHSSDEATNSKQFVALLGLSDPKVVDFLASYVTPQILIDCDKSDKIIYLTREAKELITHIATMTALESTLKANLTEI